MLKLKIERPSRYPIHIGYGLEIPRADGPKALLYDSAVEPLALDLAEQLEIPVRLGLRGGEEAKTLEVYGQTLSWLAKPALPRDTLLYVVGGGTLTDLGGFLAASYLRGIQFINIPTTTLAIVDASVGGKTGINLPEGKNLAGAFYAPEGVYAELEALQTLPLQIFKEGLVEAFKHGIIAGDEQLLEVENLSVSDSLEPYLARAIAVKVGVVETDPTEKGERRKLNLGHTLGHALEAATDHKLSHGAAVAYGLLFAALLGRAQGGEDLVPTVQKLLAWLSPAPLPGLEWDDLLAFMARDKKKLGTSLNWVVPMGMGDLSIHPIPEDTLRRCYSEFLAFEL
ncbi:MAG: 3-dehydroquinate synthase [Thermaceae bacterium]|nr:3-dehydroquinate synthase [Thermaceae bacterium]